MTRAMLREVCFAGVLLSLLTAAAHATAQPLSATSEMRSLCCRRPAWDWTHELFGSPLGFDWMPLPDISREPVPASTSPDNSACSALTYLKDNHDDAADPAATAADISSLFFQDWITLDNQPSPETLIVTSRGIACRRAASEVDRAPKPFLGFDAWLLTDIGRELNIWRRGPTPAARTGHCPAVAPAPSSPSLAEPAAIPPVLIATIEAASDAIDPKTSVAEAGVTAPFVVTIVNSGGPASDAQVIIHIPGSAEFVSGNVMAVNRETYVPSRAEFDDGKVVIHVPFLPAGQTVLAELVLGVIESGPIVLDPIVQLPGNSQQPALAAEPPQPLVDRDPSPSVASANIIPSHTPGMATWPPILILFTLSVMKFTTRHHTK